MDGWDDGRMMDGWMDAGMHGQDGRMCWMEVWRADGYM